METQQVTNLTLPEVNAQPRDHALSQWFTAPKLARQVAGWACLNWLGDIDPSVKTWKVLEPSAGDGALLRAMEQYVPRYQMWAVDIDSRNVEELANQGYNTIHDDFLALEDDEIPSRIDIAIMNPPYEKAQGERHIMHALRFTDRVIAIVPLTTLEGSARRETLWSQVQLNRMAICSTRPKFGDRAGMTAICVIDVSKPTKAKVNPYAMDGVRVEFWR